MAKVYTNLKVNGSFVYNNNPQDGYVLTTDNFGLVSWTASTALISVASDTTFGHIKVGNGLTMSGDGYLNILNSSSGPSYSAGIGLTLSGTTFSLITKNFKTIYVSVNGSDSNDGLSSLTPVLNLWYARDLAVSGDTIMVMPGDYIFDNRNSAGCPYNGLIESRVNLWKNGVSYYFMPGAKIYSYGSTSGSYSPYSDNMIFFQPNSTSYSECYVLGYLEFYATSEGADNNGGGSYLFLGEENVGTWPGFKFDLQANIIEGITGCTLIRSDRTSVTAAACYVNVDVQTIKYAYITGQSANGCWSTWRGAETAEMVINIKAKKIIATGTGDKPIFQVLPNGTKASSNYLKVNIQVDYAEFSGHSHLILYGSRSMYAYNSPSYPGISVSSGYVNLHVEKCIFSPALIRVMQGLSNYFINISGNYYDSGTTTSTFIYSTFVDGTKLFGNSPFLLVIDVANDGIGDYAIVNFTGNLYMKNATRHAVYMGALPKVGATAIYHGLNNMKINFRGDVYFNVLSDYTGDLFFVGMGKFVYSGNINGVNQYLGGTYSFSINGLNGYAGNELGPGFAGKIIKFGSYKAYATLQNSNILTSTDKQSLLLSPATYQSAYSDPTLNIYNSNIKLYATASALADGSYLNCFVENSTIRNYGDSEVFYNPVSTGNIQILNSTIVSNGTYSINYPLSTIIGAGAYSNKDIVASTLSGTVSVVGALI